MVDEDVELAEFINLTDFDFDLHGNSLEHIVVFGRA